MFFYPQGRNVNTLTVNQQKLEPNVGMFFLSLRFPK